MKQNMKVVVAVIMLAAALGLSYVTPNVEKKALQIQTYPATACPGISSDGATAVLLPSAKTQVRFVSANSLKFKGAEVRTYKLSNSPLLISGNPSTSVAISYRAGQWLGSTLCSVGLGDQWFVGGSGSVTSLARLDLVNSGLSDASVELSVFGSKSMPSTFTVIVKANSQKLIALDSLAPGESSVVVRARTRSGRVTAFLFDQQRSGLSPLGMDYVNSVSAPSTDLIIPAVLNSAGKSSKLSHFLRLLAPGILDATVKVIIHSAEGNFTPLGFDGRTISHGTVYDLPLVSILEKNPFSIEIKSDTPIVASVRSQISTSGKTEFGWGTPAQELKNLTMNLGGLAPRFVFTGEQIQVNIQWRSFATGQTGSATIAGNQIAYWQPTAGVGQISLSSEGTTTTAGMIFLTTNPKSIGLSYLPAETGAKVENSSTPVMDARTISRG
jgi:hypothetical protein